MDKVEILLALRGQLIDLQNFAKKTAESENFAAVPNFASGIVEGIGLAVNLIDGNIAVATGDRQMFIDTFKPRTEDES